MNTAPSPRNIAQWHELFCACQQKLIGYLAGKTGNIDDARDLAQETWLRVAEQVPTMQGNKDFSPDHARAYLFATANHLVIDRYRRNKLHEDCLTDLTEATPAITHDVADRVQYQQAIDAVEHTISTFPGRMRQAFVAHRMHGEKQAAIAQQLGVSLNTIERDIIQADACLEDTLHRWRGSHPDEAQLPARSKRRRMLSHLLGLGVLAGTGMPAWYFWQHRLVWEMSLASQTGQITDHALSDGSHIRLDGGSTMVVRYFAHQRIAQLTAGAAFFSVARDEQRPFIVDTDDVRVTVLGTSFGVEITADAVLVQVESGTVRVENRDGTHRASLQKGDALRIPTHVGPQSQTHWEQQKTDMPAAWRYGELVFDRDSMATVAQRLNRHADFKVEVADTARHIRISGQLRIANAQQWLHALPQVAPVRLQKLPNGGLRIVPT
jgi:transmembrane sensor